MGGLGAVLVRGWVGGEGLFGGGLLSGAGLGWWEIIEMVVVVVMSRIIDGGGESICAFVFVLCCSWW